MMRQEITEDYATLLGRFKALGYEARPFHDFDAGSRHVILRHDVDICLHRAAQMARIEADLGLSAVYYILPSSPFYNVLSIDDKALIREIADMGHEIGLHLELEADADLQAKADFEAGILSALCGKAVTSISFHRPTANASRIKFQELELNGYINAYHKRYFSDIAYVSDSRGAWTYGHPLDHDAIKAGTAMQLLTHPVWWTTPRPGSAARALTDLRGEIDQRVAAMMADTFNV